MGALGVIQLAFPGGWAADRNETVYSEIRAAIDGAYYRDPWSDEDERLVLLDEVGVSFSRLGLDPEEGLSFREQRAATS